MSRTVYSIRWRARGWVVSWPDRPNGVPSYAAPPPRRPTVRRPDPTGRSVSGFWIRQVMNANIQCAGKGGFGQSKVALSKRECRQGSLAKEQLLRLPSNTKKDDLSLGTRSMNTYITCRIQNPDIPRAGRVGAHGGVAGRGRAGPDANRTVRPGDKLPAYSPKHRRQVAGTSLQEHVQAKSYLNRWRNKARGRQPVHNWFIRGICALYQRDEKRSFFLAADQWTVAALSL